MDEEPLDSRILGHHANRVGELVLRGQDRQDGALGEGAVADFAALRGAHAAHFARAVRREVVLVHVALGFLRVDRVETLGLVEQAQGAHGQRLGLAALEQAGAVDAGQVAWTDVERANLGGATAVGALARLDHHGAHGMLLEGLAGGGDVAAPHLALILGEVVLLDGRLELFDLAHTGELVSVFEGRAHLVEVGVHALGDRRIGHVDRVFLGLGSHEGQELGLLLAERGDSLLAELHGGEHVLLGHLVGAGLDHGDVVAGACDRELEVGVLLLGIGGIDDEFAGLLIAGDANAGRGTVEGGAAAQKRSGRAADADAVGRVLAVAGQRGGDHVDFLLEAVGEAGADRTVDHTGGQRALVGGLRLALQVTAGDAADRVHLLDEVDRQRKEVVVFLLLGYDGGHQARGFALADQHGAGGLLGKLAGFETVLFAVQLEARRNLFHRDSLHFLFFFGTHAFHASSRAAQAPARTDRNMQKPA